MRTPKLSKEQQLLFNLLKGEQPATLEGVDTAILFDLFRRHRLFPIAPALLPLMEKDERERWKKAIHSRTIRSMHQLTVLHRVIEALKEAGVEAFPLKGPVLAHTLFGNMSERHSSDIDILVRHEDIQHIIEILGREGFELKYPKKGLSERQWRYYVRYKKDIGLFSKEHGLLIELHYNVENYLGIQASYVDRLIQQPEESTIGGMLFRTMNRHQAFLYLTLHGAVHQYRRLFWLRDIARAINKWDLDHLQILEDAKSMGIERMVCVSVVLANELFNVELPKAYGPYINENRKAIEKLKDSALGVILGPEFPTRRGKVSHHLFMLRLKPTMRHYLRTLGEILNRYYIGRYLGGH